MNPHQPPRTNPPPNVSPREQDPYKRTKKNKDALVCTACGLVCHEGRWYRGAAPLCDEKAALCPACERIRDRYPGGTVTLRGLPEDQRDEVLAMLRNVAEEEEREHPLERVMDVVTKDDTVVVTTTGIHLARRFSNALERRFHQGVKVRYGDEDASVRVDWTA